MANDSRQKQQADYLNFLLAHQMTAHEAKAFDAHFDRMKPLPTFEIVIICNDETVFQLAGTLGSIARQLYAQHRVSIIGQGEAPAAIRNATNLHWIISDTPWDSVRDIFCASSAEWLLLLEAGDQIVEHALPYVAEFGLRHPDALIVYTDEDQIDSAGQPSSPYFKPDFSPDYLLSFPYLGDGIFLNRRSRLVTEGLRTSDFGDPLYDLTLQVLAEFGRGAIHHIPDVLLRRHSKRSFARVLGGEAGARRAVEAYLLTTGESAKVTGGLLPGSLSVHSSLDRPFRIAVLTEAPQELGQCQQLIEKTFIEQQSLGARLLVFVSTSAQGDVLQYLIEADSAGVPGLEVYQVQDEERLLTLYDAAIRQTDAEVIAVLRGGLQPASNNWLQDLAAEATRKGVGVVAPRVLDLDGRLIGNALILGCGGVASGFGHGQRFDDWGQFGRQLVSQNPSALSLDAVCFRRSTYIDLGGFDISLDRTAASIDFCLKAKTLGLRALWTPDITMISVDKGIHTIAPHSEEALLDRWLPMIAQDPFYNRNLSRSQPFSLTERPQVSRLRLPWKPLPRLLAFPADLMGCGHYRVIEPFNAALAAGKIDGYLGVDHYDPLDLSLFDADTLLLQRQVTDAQLHYLEQYRKFFSLRLIYELDDLITNLPVRSFHRSHMPKDIAKRLRTGLRLCDRFIVSTEGLADAYRQHAPDIRVVPNRIDGEKWLHLGPERRAGAKPRVGWAGGMSHSGDLAEVADVVKELAGEVEWVFFGMCPDDIRPYVHEFHTGVPTPEYPAKLASLNLDLALAPIEHNHFNECKSNLKLLEYGVLGFPVIASDFGPYRCNFPVTLVKNRSRDWINAIREHLSDLDELARRGDNLRQHVVGHWLLQDHLDEWMDAWFRF